MKTHRVVLLALNTFALFTLASAALGQGSHTAASLREFWESPSPQPAAHTAAPAPQPRKPPVKRAASIARPSRPSIQPVANISPPRKARTSGSRWKNTPKTATPPSPFNWSKAGNLDALPYDRDTTSGFLLSGNTSEIRIPTTVDTAGTLAVLLKSLGKGIAFFFGLIAMFLCWIAKAIVNLFSGGGTAASNSRSGLDTRSKGLSPVVAAGAFVVGVIIALVIPMPTPSLPTEPEKPKTLVFNPWHSNEFLFHVALPEKVEKEKHAESKSGMNIVYTVVGYRDKKNPKNEIAIGYAKLPDMQEMIKAKQRSQPFQFSMPGTTTYYYFDVEKGLDAAVNSMKEQGKINVTYQCPLLLNRKLPGRELEGTAPGDRYIRSRVYCGYGNYYQTIVVGDREFVNSNDAYKFLDSFATDGAS